MSEVNKDIKHFDVDKVIEFIGPLGKWQWFQNVLLFFVGVTAGIGAVTFAFTGYMPQHRCSLPNCENVNLTNYKWFKDENLTDFLKEKSCLRLDLKDEYYGTCTEYLIMLKDSKTEKMWKSCEPSGLIFDRSIVKSSIPEDFDMVCDDSFLKSIYSSLFTGSFVIGVISDYFGRSRAISASIFLTSVSAILTTLINDKISLALLRVVYGIGTKGCIMVLYVMAAESTLPNYKVFIMFIGGIGFQFGEVCFAIEAYFLRNWKPLQLVAHSPMLLLFLITIVAMPESARWLVSKGKLEKAKKILCKRAKVNNGKTIPNELFVPANNTPSINQKLSFMESIITIISNKKLLTRSLNIFAQWFAAFIGYYGTLYTSTSLSGDPHINFIIAMGSGVPGNFLYLLLPDRIGRRATFILTELTLGISCLGTAVLLHFNTLMPLQIAFAMMGRFVASVSIKTCYLCTAELFPTPIRNSAVGVGSIVGGIGSILGFILEIFGTYWVSLPILIVGSVNILASILVIFLPETKRAKLPETMDDILK